MVQPNPTETPDDYFEDTYARPPVPKRTRLSTMLLNRSGSIQAVRLIQGLPALAAVFLAVAVALAPRENLEADYRSQAKEALKLGDFHRLEAIAQRLLQLNVFNAENQFWAAVALDGLGERDRAEAVASHIAPLNTVGFGPAHFWLAERLLRTDPLTPAALQRAEDHLRRVGETQETSKPVARRLAQVLLKTNRIADAKRLLTLDLLLAYPELRVMYGEALLKSGERVEAENQLRQAVSALKPRVQASPDDVMTRWSLVEAYMAARDYPTAERMLVDGRALGKSPLLSRLTANFYMRWIGETEAGLLPIGPSKRAVDDAADRLKGAGEDSLQLKGLLVNLYRYSNRLEEAQSLLESLAGKNVGAAFDLMRLYQQRGQAKVAADLAKDVSDRLQKALAAGEDSYSLRERSAVAAVACGRFALAKSTLEDGYRISKDDRYKVLTAGVLVTWWDAAVHKKAEGPAQPLELLREAVKLDPWNAAAIQRLAAAPESVADEARKMLNELLARGESPPAAVHWILGNCAWLRGDKVLAKNHLEQAHKLQSRNPLVLNNLAWVLGESSPPELQRALQMADQAVELAPAAAEMRDTRGRINAKLGRWKEALADLQICMPIKKDDPEFHRIIADAFESQQMKELAEHHRKLALETAIKRQAP